ncbi:hypothetical protein NLJ89_g6197 [Agrocybe chaxingu]|uniref:Protein kinase domain-containing protein n=1 Tax=Agrocybe chaxingu TaxID=84603 RepID=A0A9W8K6W3_9AGAR|nr:hypothetical protein NLJ89_g6197 [Agrocybe chaxingu]
MSSCSINEEANPAFESPTEYGASSKTIGSAARSALPKDLEFWSTIYERDMYVQTWKTVANLVLNREGFTLWDHFDECNQVVKGLPKPSGYSFLGPNNPDPGLMLTYWGLSTGLSHAVRGDDGRDYIVTLVTVGEEGHEHLRTLRRLSFSVDPLLSNNHILPIIKEITYEDLTFVVVPKAMYKVQEGLHQRFKNSVEDVVYMLIQAVEAIIDIHQHRIAHRDLFLDNFIVDWFPESMIARKSVVRPRVYLIDFETAIDMSDPEQLCRGLPFPDDKYFRPRAPELSTPEEPYCPFSLDIWQFGTSVLKHFPSSGIPEIDAIWPTLVSENSQDRPTAKEVMDKLNEVVRSIRPSDLHLSVKDTYLTDI